MLGMTTKEKIIAALESMRHEIESECFCRIALTGGYENHIRDFLYEGLLILGERNLKTEVNYSRLNTNGKKEHNRLDLISGNPTDLDYFVELGHNGTWQGSFDVVNHAIDDINRSFDFTISSKERFTVSILTNILDFKESESFRFRQSYLNDIRKNKKDPEQKLNETRSFFASLDAYASDTTVEIFPKMSPTNLKGFLIDIHIFVAGSFEMMIPKDEVKII